MAMGYCSMIETVLEMLLKKLSTPHTYTLTHTHIHTVGLHKKMVSTLLSNASKITHHYEIGSEFRGYAAKMTHE